MVDHPDEVLSDLVVEYDRLDEILSGRGIKVRRYMKPTFARPAPKALMQTIAGECGVVIEGLAD